MGIQEGGSVFVCVCACVCLCTWVSWQPSEEGSRPSDIPAAKPTPYRRPLISKNKRGRACNSSKIARGVEGVEGCKESDAMPCSARIHYELLNNTLWRENKGEVLLMSGRIHSLPCCVYCAFDNVNLESKCICVCVCMWCACGCVRLPQLFITKWQPDKLWL